MIIYNIVALVCLIIMLLGAVTVVYNLFAKKREDKITYIRSFRKGKGVLIYIFAVPLYWMGMVYSGGDVFISFFKAIPKVIELLVLKYDTSTMQALMDVSPIFFVAVYCCYVLVGLNAIMFGLSLANQYLWTFVKKIAFKFTGKEKLYLFGNNPQNHLIYKSDKKRAKIIVAKITDAEATHLYIKGYIYHQARSYKDYINEKVKECVNKNKKVYAVINTGDDESNIKLVRHFVNAITSCDEEQRKKLFGVLRIFVFGDTGYEAIYEDIVADGFGCIFYVNKYQKIAVDFIDKYPLTKFMNESQIDYKTSLVKQSVNINVVMIGFGRTNREIFLTSVANNQFITEGKNGVELKQVNYHIFDKCEAENDKNLNHNYNRYKNECKDFNPKDYLPLPDQPANEIFYHLDVNDTEFYDKIKGVVTLNKNDANFIVIAFGSDLENIDLARKFAVKRNEWGVENLVIFVKVRSDHKEQFLLDEKDCYMIANENSVVYNIDKLLGDNLLTMAMLRNEVYQIEYEITHRENKTVSEENVNKIKAEADYDWYSEKTQLERKSSLYGCLSLRMKLNLMGLDYVPEDCDGKALSEAEYMKVYAGDDMPDTSYYKVTADGKPIIKYNLSFAESRRKNLAVHEHLRWNSYMISNGVIPASIDLIENEQIVEKGKTKRTNGKNYRVRRHGCLTTFDGLVTYRNIVAKKCLKDGETLLQAEERCDVIKYDYQLLDDAYWFLKKVGQKIVKK